MGAPLRVIVIEDEALILMQIEMLLEDAGVDVVGTAVSQDEAVALAHEARPDIAFVDLRLKGGSSGRAAAKAMQDIPNLLVVFMTANARELPEDLDGAMAVLPKPFSERVFLSALPFLEQCVRNPPPVLQKPQGLFLAPWYGDLIVSTIALHKAPAEAP